MKVIGITGNIATGKSLLTHLIASNFKCKIFDADKIVHDLYSKNYKIINEIKGIEPDAISESGINRKVLLQKILRDRSILIKIEKIVHPELCKILLSFLKLCRRNDVRIVVLNIPLLFVIKADLLCDEIFVLTVNRVISKSRLKSRYGCTNNFIIRNQEKVNSGAFCVRSGIAKFNLLKRFYTAMAEPRKLNNHGTVNKVD